MCCRLRSGESYHVCYDPAGGFTATDVRGHAGSGTTRQEAVHGLERSIELAGCHSRPIATSHHSHGEANMLVLTRRAGEAITIGREIVVTVLAVTGGRVKVAVEAPDAVRIVRSELEADATDGAPPDRKGP